MATPQTDIVICVRSTPAFPIHRDFRECVNTLQNTTQNFRLILLDDNSDAEGAATVAELATRFGNSLLIRTHSQNWFTRAYNKGLRMVKTPWAVILNADCWMNEGWLDELYAVAEEVGQNYKVGLVGSDFQPGHPQRYVCTKQNQGYVTAHCVLMNMQALMEASINRGTPGWYLDEIDPRCIHIRSDIEICWRLNSIGYQTVMSPRSHVGHLGGKSWGHLLGTIPTNIDALANL